MNGRDPVRLLRPESGRGALAALGLVLALAVLALLVRAVGAGAEGRDGLDAELSQDTPRSNGGPLPAPTRVAPPTAEAPESAPASERAPVETDGHASSTPAAPPVLVFSDGSVGNDVVYQLRDRVLSTRRKNVSMHGTTDASGRFPEWPETERELVLLLPGTQVGMQSRGHPFRFELEGGRAQLGVRRVLVELDAPAGHEGRRANVQLSTRGNDGILRYTQVGPPLGDALDPVYAEGDDPLRVHAFLPRRDAADLDLQGEAIVPYGAGTQEPVPVLLRPTPRGGLRVTLPEEGEDLRLTFRLAGVAPPWPEGWEPRELGPVHEVPSGRFSLRLDPAELEASLSAFVPAALRRTVDVEPGRTTEVELALVRAAHLVVGVAPGTHARTPRADGREAPEFVVADGTPFLITLTRDRKSVPTRWRTGVGGEEAVLRAGSETFASSSLPPGTYKVLFGIRGAPRSGPPVMVELEPGEVARIEMP